jgi:hypothetical protein
MKILLFATMVALVAIKKSTSITGILSMNAWSISALP